MELEVVLSILRFAGVFIGLSFVVFWVGLVWWVSQDVVTRTEDKIILAVSVALASIFGPIGVLLYLIIRPRQTIKETYREMLETEINRKLASLDMTYCPFCGAHLEKDMAGHEGGVHPDQLTIEDVEPTLELGPQVETGRLESGRRGRAAARRRKSKGSLFAGLSALVLGVGRAVMAVLAGIGDAVRWVAGQVIALGKAAGRQLSFLTMPLPKDGASGLKVGKTGATVEQSRQPVESKAVEVGEDKSSKEEIDQEEADREEGRAEAEKEEDKGGSTVDRSGSPDSKDSKDSQDATEKKVAAKRPATGKKRSPRKASAGTKKRVKK